MTARAVKKPTPSRRLPFDQQAKIIDNALPSKEFGDLLRVVIGGVSAPIGVDDATKESLEQAAQKRRERLERRKKRLQPVKNPVSFVVKEARREQRERDLQDAYDATFAYSLRPKCKVREYDAWTPEQREQFKRRLLAFVRSTPEPTPDQKQLVKADLKRLAREWSGRSEDVRDEPWMDGKRYAIRRLECGYVGEAGHCAGKNEDYVINDDWNEQYLRSTLSPVLERFVRATPKAGAKRIRAGVEMQRLMAGPAKDERRREWTKLHGLDQPYIQLLSVMRHGFRHELDRVYKSWEHLRRAVAKKVRRRRLACMPHVVVGHVDALTGEVHNPHLWWLLPEEDVVLYDHDNPKADKRCMRLYDGVVVGSFLELRDLGADAGGLTNPIDGKNPLSPEWSFQVWNETDVR